MTIYSWRDDEKVKCKFDKEVKNRYLLNCLWNDEKPVVTFILCNPSAGNDSNADATLRRCADFSRSWGYGSMIIVNLYSQITKDPSLLKSPSSNEEELNNKYILDAVSQSKLVIFGWGEIEKHFKNRVNEIKESVPRNKQFCIKKTSNGKYPRHPLFLSKDLTPISWDSNVGPT